ncbi:hypothetical protein V1515DRAFT_641081 [Lipomyces mesembrius]
MQLGMMDYPLIIPNQPLSPTQIDPQSSLMPMTFRNQMQSSLPGTAVHPLTAAQVSHPVTIIPTTPYFPTSTVPSHSSSNQGIDRNGRRRRVYCRHVLTCPWHIIGFQRKLERDRHHTPKHGVPQYECRFWAGSGKEIFEGAGHERNVHGYYIATQRGRYSSLDEAEMVKVEALTFIIIF